MYPNIVRVILDDALKLIQNKKKGIYKYILWWSIKKKTTNYIYNYLENHKEHTQISRIWNFRIWKFLILI